MAQFLLILLGIYLFSRIASRYILPWLVKYYIRKFQKRFEQQQQQRYNSYSQPQKPTHDIPKTKIKRTSNAIGEYVDYEEIK